MKKLKFIEPAGAYSNVFSKFMTIPMLGPLILGTMARQEGYEVEVINENIIRREVDPEEIGDADILALSCMTPTINRGKQIAEDYRKIRKDKNLESRVIVGGIHASMMPEDVTDDFDQVLVGEGENVFLDMISGKNQEKIVRGTPVKSLDSVVSPDFSILKGNDKIRIYPVSTSRGCKYSCDFCSVIKMFGRGYRVQSPERVIRELERYRDSKVFFVDDHAVLDPKRTEKITDMMIERDLNITYTAQMGVNEIIKNPGLISKMKKAGLSRTYIGYESPDPASLKAMKKAQTVENMELSAKILHENGIEIHAMMIFGSDADTKDSFKRTRDWVQENSIDSVQYLISTPLPGTDLYARLESEGRLLHKKWDFYDTMRVVFQPSNMTPEELQQGMISCFNDFYNYKNALSKAARSTASIAVKSLSSLYKKTHFPSYYPAAIRAYGKKIVKDWLNDARNIEYLDYLSKLPNADKKQTLQ